LVGAKLPPDRLDAAFDVEFEMRDLGIGHMDDARALMAPFASPG
jgi:hypothetical protein